MRKAVVFIFILATAIGAYVILGGAESFAVGKTTLAGKVIELNGRTITARGNARLATAAYGSTLKSGTTRIESIRAETIRLALAVDKNNQTTVKEATATGRVTIKAKRSERSADRAVSIVQDVHAVAGKATFVENQNLVVLTGKVVVKITEPGIKEPVAVLSGEKVTVSLSDNRIRVEGGAGSPARTTITPKE